MRTRTFANAGIKVTELALGAWAIGGENYGPVDEAQALATIEAYLAGGGNCIDTAHGYGASEERIGKALRQGGYPRDSLVLASKTPRGTSREDISGMREHLEQSLRRLDTDYIDIYQLHSPPEDPEIQLAALEEMQAFKSEGKIRAVGASIKGPNVTAETVELCRRYVDSGMVDALQLIYSVLRQGNRESIDYAESKGVGCIIRTVLESGFLTGKYDGKTSFAEHDHRNRWKVEQIARFKEIVLELESRYLGGSYGSVPQLAIAFALEPPGATTLILGAKTPDQVSRNLASAQLPRIPKSLAQQLKDSYLFFNDEANLR